MNRVHEVGSKYLPWIVGGTLVCAGLLKIEKIKTFVKDFFDSVRCFLFSSEDSTNEGLASEGLTFDKFYQNLHELNTTVINGLKDKKITFITFYPKGKNPDGIKLSVYHDRNQVFEIPKEKVQQIYNKLSDVHQVREYTLNARANYLEIVNGRAHGRNKDFEQTFHIETI